MLVKKEKRKIPRKALEPLMDMCEWESKESGESAMEIFKQYLGLMDKYADYFFSEPWPKDYDYEKATTFADEDMEFLLEKDAGLGERFETMCLKKNMHLEGFMGIFGMYWTRQAFYKEFIRPELMPIIEAFKACAEKDTDARSVLNNLKEHFKEDVWSIHAALVDMLENGYLGKEKDLLVAKILEMIHTEEGLPPCSEYRCKRQREMLHENQDKNADV
jgi:hypothetical protein